MTKLRCNVMSCSNNKDDCCCRPEIQVSGNEGSEDVFCASFVDATKGAQNSIGCCLPNTSVEVSCDAEDCIYNSNLKCQSDNVRISAKTSAPYSQSGTLCSCYRRK